MGFYDEDDTFCQVPAREKLNIFKSNQPKRRCLDQPSTSRIEKQNGPAFDDSLAETESFNAHEEMEHNSEESSIRHEVLRLIGLSESPCRPLRKYMKKVAKGAVQNPWVSKVQSEKTLRKTLRRFMLGMIILACENEGIEDCQLEQSYREAFESIDHLNEEIIQSLKAIGNFSSEQLRYAKNNCQKAFVSRKFANAMVSQIPGDYTHCQVPECSHSIETHDDVNYLIVEGGLYSHKFEMPNHSESPIKLLCLCSFHNGIFEFMFDIIHMKWNVYQNCLVHVRKILESKRFKDSDDVIDELPSVVLRSLVHFYMARYFCLWAFGDTELWTKNGFTLFQALFGSK